MSLFPAIKTFFVTLTGRNSLVKEMRLRSTVGDIVVSTVKLPIIHGIHWYETAAFIGGDSDVLDRYVTEIDARRGHDHYVKMAQEHGRVMVKLLS